MIILLYNDAISTNLSLDFESDYVTIFKALVFSVFLLFLFFAFIYGSITLLSVMLMSTQYILRFLIYKWNKFVRFGKSMKIYCDSATVNIRCQIN